MNGREEPQATCNRKLINSKLKSVPKSHWCWWVWSTSQMWEISWTHKIRLWGEQTVELTEKEDYACTYSLERMSWNNRYDILAVIHHQFSRVQGLLDLFKEKSVTCIWPTLTLSPACTKSGWPFLLLQRKLLKIIVLPQEGLQACFAVPTEIHCGFTIDHQRAKRRISFLWKEMVFSNFLFVVVFVFTVQVLSSNLLKSFSFSLQNAFIQ